MATEKKTATAKPLAKAVAAKAEDVKTAAPAAEVKEEVKKAPAKKAAAPKKEAAKKAPAKKAEAPKAAAKKAPAKKAAAPKKEAAKKAVASLYVQFADKSYSMDELVKIAEDVWVYDLGKKASDMKSVEIYVKPEESRAYFVVNGTENGSFLI